MKVIRKQYKENLKENELARRFLKQMLYTLHISEGFGRDRLLRVLMEWTEQQNKIINASTEIKSDMLIEIDTILDTVMPSKFIDDVTGREKLRNKKGKIIK